MSTAQTVRDGARGVYTIAVAAEILGVGIQTLRLYEAKGLIEPDRTAGGTRRFSDDDLAVVHRVLALLADGINLPGARRVLELEEENRRLRARVADLNGSRKARARR
ncbi:MerR family transcriptional regulator [Microbacterium sp. 1P10UB]|uniref:MerR family transcriptional regulator n=1 Tax=unclassified Microbacterium TaxID=2609290 RepID=UPI00399FF2C5